jgi:hypothetical protein
MGSVQCGLVGAGFIVPFAGLVGKRALAGETGLQCHGSPDLCWAVSFGAKSVKALAIVKLDTVICWHRAGFRLYWRWKSRHRCGRPAVPLENCQLIREMSIVDSFWEVPRIHGELLHLDIDISQTSVAKYMARRWGPPSQGWKTFQLDGWHLSQRTSSSCRQSRSDCSIVGDHAPWPALDPVARGDRAPDGRMDCQSAH